MLARAQLPLGPIFEDHLSLHDLLEVQGWAQLQVDTQGDDVEAWFSIALQRAASHHNLTEDELLRRIVAAERSSLLVRASYAA